jgi:hypothetical protein
MTCKVKTTPRQHFTVQWMKNDGSIRATSVTSPEDGVLQLDLQEQIWENATYHCKVSIGKDRTINTLKALTHLPSLKEEHNIHEADKMLSTATGQRYARDKVALLIGNQKYRECGDLNKLRFMEKTVESVAKKLTTLDFKVFVFVNLTLSEMNKVLTWFYTLLSSGVYGLFYYAGHGFHATHSYLIPVDIKLPNPDPKDCILSSTISSNMQEKLCRAVLVLDCCRNTKKDESNRVPTPPPTANLVVIHSTSPGEIAVDGSAFTESFIEALDINKNVNMLQNEILKKVEIKAPKDPKPWPGCTNMHDVEMSLRDPIMRDSMEVHKQGEKVWDCTDYIHALPDPVILEGESVRSLAEHISLRLTFTAKFANVLRVNVEAHLKHPNITAAVIKPLFEQVTKVYILIDESETEEVYKMLEQGVEVEWDTKEKPENKPKNFCSFCVRDQQRLKEPLILKLGVTVKRAGSEDMHEVIRHTLPPESLLSVRLQPISDN